MTWSLFMGLCLGLTTGPVSGLVVFVTVTVTMPQQATLLLNMHAVQPQQSPQGTRICAAANTRKAPGSAVTDNVNSFIAGLGRPSYAQQWGMQHNGAATCPQMQHPDIPENRTESAARCTLQAPLPVRTAAANQDRAQHNKADSSQRLLKDSVKHTPPSTSLSTPLRSMLGTLCLDSRMRVCGLACPAHLHTQHSTAQHSVAQHKPSPDARCCKPAQAFAQCPLHFFFRCKGLVRAKPYPPHAHKPVQGRRTRSEPGRHGTRQARHTCAPQDRTLNHAPQTPDTCRPQQQTNATRSPTTNLATRNACETVTFSCTAHPLTQTPLLLLARPDRRTRAHSRAAPALNSLDTEGRRSASAKSLLVSAALQTYNRSRMCTPGSV